MESTLYLMKDVDLDPNYNYTIDFDSIEAQESYFNNKISSALEITEGYSHIKFNEPIKVYQNIDELFGVNYLRFENHNKTYYAFILNKKWVSESCTALEFKIDVFQTFMFNYEIDETFIEREHQDRYNKELKPIYNLESEQLERGEFYIKQKSTRIKPTYHNFYSIRNDDFTYDENVPDISLPSDEGGAHDVVWLKIIAKEPIHNNDTVYNVYANKKSISGCSKVNDMPTNVYSYFTCVSLTGTHRLGVQNPNDPLTYQNEYEFSGTALKSLCEDTRIITINISKYPPIEMLWYESGGTNILMPNYKLDLFGNIVYFCKYDKITGGLFYINKLSTYKHSMDYVIEQEKIDVKLDINNLKSIKYEPKLLTKDYTYNELNINEQRKSFYNEYIEDDFKLKLIDTLSVKNGSAVVPCNYMKSEIDYNNIIKLDSINNELPLITDAWLQYLSQHKNSMITGLRTTLIQGGAGAFMGLVGGIAGLATGGVGSLIGLLAGGGTIINTASNIASQLAQIKDLKETPDEIKQTSLDLILTAGIDKLFYKFDVYTIDEKFKNKIFNYFFHYGYKCNDFKKPNVRSRYYFNYIKTIGANIKTNIDADFKAELMRIYDTGITIWHYRTADTFKGVNNYDYENVEMNLIGGTNG